MGRFRGADDDAEQLPEAPSRGAYLRRPARRILRGPGWIHFHVDPSHCGLRLWGRPGDSAESLSEVIDDVRSAPRYIVADLRAQIVVGEADLGGLGQVMMSLLQQADKARAELMVLRPPGLSGVVVTGVLATLTDISSVRLPADVLDGLGGLAPETRELLAAVLGGAGTARVSTDGEPILVRLRAALRQHPAGLDLPGAAQALATSVRSLQRRLQTLGTTCSAELTAARVDNARELLLTTNDKVATVAQRVGCCSSQHLRRLFKCVDGDTPGSFRRRSREQTDGVASLGDGRARRGEVEGADLGEPA